MILNYLNHLNLGILQKVQSYFHVSQRLDRYILTLTSGWSGATPNLTKPNGTGSFSYTSTLAVLCPWKQQQNSKVRDWISFCYHYNDMLVDQPIIKSLAPWSLVDSKCVDQTIFLMQMLEESTMVQVMAWCYQTMSHYLNHWWPNCMTQGPMRCLSREHPSSIYGTYYM